MTKSTRTVMPAVKLLGGEYPTRWADFIGQAQAKAQLITAARSARKRKVAMPHTLLESGQPGIGKTSLALLTAAECRASTRIISGKVTLNDARMAFAEMQDGDVLIIDEAHQLVAGGKASSEWLLNYLQDGVILTPLGPETQPKVTIIACTTEAARLPETLLSRFRCRPVLISYTDDEAAKIAQVMAKRIFAGLPMPTMKNCRAIGIAASANPRSIAAILDNVRDIFLVHGKTNFDGKEYDLTLALEWLGLTPDGLTSTCRRYMRVLLEDFAGSPAGATAIQDRLQEPGGLGYTERLLMDKNLIAKSKSGRLLTQAGIKLAREMAEAEAA